MHNDCGCVADLRGKGGPWEGETCYSPGVEIGDGGAWVRLRETEREREEEK